MLHLRPFPLALVLAVAMVPLRGAPLARAQSGVAVTPDRSSYLVNKDLAGERWTISLNLSAEDPGRTLITNVTGNVFREGEPPVFVVCQPAADSTGTLADPGSTLRLSCDVAPACADSALACSQSTWSLVTRTLELPAAFFLPGAADVTAERAAAAPGAPQQVATDRGATLSYDGLSYLVSKDIGAQRWSIVANFAPRAAEGGGVREELSSITGNVFKRDGTPPQFVYCEETDASQGDLGDPSSLFRFRCLGADACTAAVDECAARWTVISDAIELEAGFFLPEGGAGVPRSDPEIVVIGRTSDPPSIATDEFNLPGAAAAASERQGGACSGACLVERLGGCSGVRGELRAADDGRCLCFVDDPGDTCITCGTDVIAGQCGSACSYPVGSRTARGLCLPFDALSADCLCSAVGADGDGAPASCGGPLASSCPGDGRCCVDDPSDGCDPAEGDASCAGACVRADGCGAGAQQCGACADPCGNGVAEGLEQCDGADLRGQSCASGGTLACRANCTVDSSGCAGGTCGDGRIDSGESCDGANLGGESCGSLGYDTGVLSCDAACRFVTAQCISGPQEPPTPTPSPAPPPAAAPQITSLTCNGRSACTVLPGAPFDVTFAYVDPNGDATEYALFLDGAPFLSDAVASGAAGTVSVQLVAGTCPEQCCLTNDFLFTATVADAAGNVSDLAGPLVQTTDYEAVCP